MRIAKSLSPGGWQSVLEMRLLRCASATGCVLVGLALSLAWPSLAHARTDVVLGTATAGGGFEVYGAVVAKTVNAADPTLAVEARRTAGSAENLALLTAGKVDLALVQGEAAYEALVAPGAKPHALRIVAAMYPTAGMFVVPADSAFRTIDELKGQAIVFGARSSGLVNLARYVLGGLGYDMDRDFMPILLERAGEGPALLASGKVAALWGGGNAWPVFKAVMESPRGGRFIAPNDEQIARIRERFPFLQAQTLPPGSYPGQLDAIPSVGSWSFILAGERVPEETVYRFCRALFVGEGDPVRRDPLLRETTAASTAAYAPERWLIHPGARRLLAERGLLP